MSDYNKHKAAERSAIAFDEIMEQTRVWGYEIIKNVIINSPPIEEGLMVDPMLILRKVWDKLEQEYIKQRLKKAGQTEYVYNTDDNKPRRVS